jgi:hypothetical protein
MTNTWFPETIRFGAVAGDIPLRTNGFNEATDRCEIQISGGAGRMSIQALRHDLSLTESEKIIGIY